MGVCWACGNGSCADVRDAGSAELLWRAWRGLSAPTGVEYGFAGIRRQRALDGCGDGEFRRGPWQDDRAADCGGVDSDQYGLAATAVGYRTGEPRIHGGGGADSARGGHWQARKRHGRDRWR